MAKVLFGFAKQCIFITCYQYLIDVYEKQAASAPAAATLAKYVAAGGMVVVITPMYEKIRSGLDADTAGLHFPDDDPSTTCLLLLWRKSLR